MIIQLSGTELPSDGYLQSDNTKIPLIMGTYSWNHIEADSPSPKELTSDAMQLTINREKNISINFKSDNQPSQLHIYNWSDLEKDKEIATFDGNLFISPSEEGEYIYTE